jgi:hypothetical protein
MTRAPSKPDLEKEGRLNPWHVIEVGADLHIVCRETAVLVDWIAALEARHKQLTALADKLENKQAGQLGRPLGRVWNKIAGRRTKKRLKEIWKETEVTPDRIRLLVRLLILNVCFIADSIGKLYRQIGHLAWEYNEYAIAKGLDERFEPPNDVPDLLKVAERIQRVLKPARDSIAHPYRKKKLTSRGSVDRAATLGELLQIHEIEMNRQVTLAAEFQGGGGAV